MWGAAGSGSAKGQTMWRAGGSASTVPVAMTGAATVAVAFTLLGPTALAHPVSQPASQPASVVNVTHEATDPATGADARLKLRKRLAHETAVRGDKDRGVHAIEHVTELQYRLRRAHVYRGPVTGYFGGLTHAAVQRFQRRADLPVSGTADRATWKVLLKRTVRNRDALPRLCTNGTGWHACYDRSRHQLTLWKRGRLWNSWLVRGGDRGYETRTGTFRVFYRDRDHVSSIYGTAMPYSQFFSGGQAFHGSPSMLDPYEGHSHGCVNMYNEDARQLWALTHKVNLKVHVYGKWS